MNGTTKKVIFSVLALLLCVIVYVLMLYNRKTSKPYDSLKNAQENAYFVQFLFLSRGKLEPDTLMAFENLERLWLSFDKGSKLNETEWAKLRLPPGLKHLWLSGVPEKHFPALLRQISRLETLALSCYSSALGSGEPLTPAFSLRKYTALRELNVGLCSFEKLSGGIGELTRLESIRITSSSFKRLPADFIALRNLKYLSISSQSLEELPPGFHKLSGLKTLRLRSTIIKNPFVELRRLPALSRLELSGPRRRKQIISLELMPGDFPALEDLRIDYYEMNKLSGLEHLRNLRELRLEDVKLNEPQINWSFPGGLKILELSGLGLRNAPPEIGTLSELETLILSGNCMKDLPPEFRNLKKLTWLSLNDTGIEHYPKSLMKLSDLSLDNSGLSEYYKKKCNEEPHE